MPENLPGGCGSVCDARRLCGGEMQRGGEVNVGPGADSARAAVGFLVETVVAGGSVGHSLLALVERHYV